MGTPLTDTYMAAFLVISMFTTYIVSQGVLMDILLLSRVIRIIRIDPSCVRIFVGPVTSFIGLTQRMARVED